MRCSLWETTLSVHAFTPSQRRKTMFQLFVQVESAGRPGFAQVTYHEVTFGPCLCGHHQGIDTISPPITRRVTEEMAGILKQRERVFLLLDGDALTRFSAALFMRLMRLRAIYEQSRNKISVLLEVEVYVLM